MDIITLCVTFIASIIAVAYPIIFQVSSTLDDKYASQIVLKLFSKELENRTFLITLYISLLSILLRYANIKPISYFEGIFIVDNSATILLVLSTISLVVSFILLVRKTLIYITPSKFLVYLINKHDQHHTNKKPNYFIKFLRRKEYNEEPIEFNFFKAISAVFFFSIRTKNVNHCKTVTDFMYKVYKDFRKENQGKFIEYPNAYYDVIYRGIIEVSENKSKLLEFLEYRLGGAVWLIGELSHTRVSKLTYKYIWSNLITAIHYNNDDLIIYYWQNASQYFNYYLPKIQKEYDFNSPNLDITNEIKIKEREDERYDFLEVTYFLGGLLLYEKKYNLIKRIFNYTNSEPYRFDLLPESLQEIFDFYLQIKKPFNSRYDFLCYNFPRIEGLKGNATIIHWVCKYLALLLIRQYSIKPYLITQKPLDLPEIPNNQSDKHFLINSISYLENLVNEITKSNDLIRSLNFEYINNEWFNKSELPDPITLLNNYKTDLENSFRKTEESHVVSTEKRSKFIESTIENLNKIKDLGSNILKNENIIADYSSWFIIGIKSVVDKSTFSDNTVAHHINFDSYLSEDILFRFHEVFSSTFFYNKSVKYLLNPNDVFAAIEKLEINELEYILVNFGQNLNYLSEEYKINELTEKYYKKIPIVTFRLCNHDLMGESIFIIKKNDLPTIIFNDITEDEINKYKLLKIDPDLNAYYSILDPNVESFLKNEIGSEDIKIEELKKSFLVYLAVNIEIRWKKNIECYMLQTNSPYSERGIPNKLDDVTRIK